MNIREGLAGSWFFQGWKTDQLDSLLALGRQSLYPAGKEILSQGDAAETIYILLAGVVSLKMKAPGHGELIVSTLRQTGEIFGWSALVEEGRSTASAESLEESYVLSFRKKELEEFFQREPRLGYQFMKKLASLISRRLENTRNLLLKEIS